jgi:hypothetical protein
MPPIILPDGAVLDVSVDVSIDCSNRIACISDAARYCGTIGDNCGGTLNCGDCPTGQICRNSVCAIVDDGCTPLPCKQPGGTYCGSIGDGCVASARRRSSAAEAGSPTSAVPIPILAIAHR